MEFDRDAVKALFQSVEQLYEIVYEYICLRAQWDDEYSDLTWRCWRLDLEACTDSGIVLTWNQYDRHDKLTEGTLCIRLDDLFDPNLQARVKAQKEEEARQKAKAEAEAKKAAEDAQERQERELFARLQAKYG